MPRAKVPKWSTACKDWERRIVAGKSLIPPPIFPAEAEHALTVFKGLRMVDVAGSPTYGEACDQWVFDLVASVFGAYNAETGERLISEWFVLVPKKNGKSSIAAGIMMTALILNWRLSAEYTILAPTVEVAGNSFDPAKDMCAERNDAEMAALFHTQHHTKTITHRINAASLQVLAAETQTVAGSKAAGTLVDELHLFGEMSEANDMLLEATGGQASRDEGFVIYLTTQSAKAPAGVYAQKLEYARGVRDGRIVDPQFVPVLYEFPPGMVQREEHLNPDNWHIVNPSMGRSVSRKFLERRYAEAQEAGIEAVRVWLAKHLNIQAEAALISQRWAGALVWSAPKCTRPQLRGPQAEVLAYMLACCDCFTAGIDGGGLDDLLALCLLGRERVTQHWLAWAHAWAHPIAVERRKSEKSRYEDFERDGDLTIMAALPGDVSACAQVVGTVWRTGRLASVGMDPEKSHKVMLGALKLERIDEKRCFGVSQGWHLMGAATLVERRLVEGTLQHGGTRMMAWAIANMREEPRGNATVITKAASGKGKIDPGMALLDAAHMMALAPRPAPNMDGFFDRPVIA